MTEPRRCASCGAVETRWKVGRYEHTNINPLNGECVDCTAKHAREHHRPAEELSPDPRTAQLPMGDRE